MLVYVGGGGGGEMLKVGKMITLTVDVNTWSKTPLYSK